MKDMLLTQDVGFPSPSGPFEGRTSHVFMMSLMNDERHQTPINLLTSKNSHPNQNIRASSRD